MRRLKLVWEIGSRESRIGKIEGGNLEEHRDF